MKALLGRAYRSIFTVPGVGHHSPRAPLFLHVSLASYVYFPRPISSVNKAQLRSWLPVNIGICTRLSFISPSLHLHHRHTAHPQRRNINYVCTHKQRSLTYNTLPKQHERPPTIPKLHRQSRECTLPTHLLATHDLTVTQSASNQPDPALKQWLDQQLAALDDFGYEADGTCLLPLVPRPARVTRPSS